MESTITVDPLLWSLLVGAVIPVVVAFATKLSASGGVKALIAVVLSTAAGVVITINQQVGNSFSWKMLAFTGATALITAISTYLGVWKPAVAINNVTAPTFGIGPKSS